MRISDWSSDVCSSDLGQLLFQPAHRIEVVAIQRAGDQPVVPIAGEQQSRLMPGILHPVFRDLYAQGARLATERRLARQAARSEEHTSELHSLMSISYAGFCLKKKK